MWRYRELLPLFAGESPVTLGEGWTPLIHAARLGAALGLRRLYIKDESLEPDQLVQGARPVGGDHSRPRTRRHDDLRADGRQRRQRDGGVLRPPPGSTRDVFMPTRREAAVHRRVPSCTARMSTLVDGLITDAGRIAAERGGPLGWYDVSTLKEPYRLEGKKTMAFELAEQLDWRVARLDPLSDRRRHRPHRHVEGVRRDSSASAGSARPAAAHGVGPGRGLCADRPRVSSGRRSRGAVGRSRTHRRRPARAEGGRRLPDAARDPRERRHGNRGQRRLDGRRDAPDRPLEGISAAPEGGAALAALTRSWQHGQIGQDDVVVLFNTGGALNTWMC